ncbi:hypothetical protein KKI24_23735 [bacterium]|nr:hypothetical protein [bacterium]
MQKTTADLFKGLLTVSLLICMLLPMADHVLAADEAAGEDPVETAFFSGGAVNGYFENQTAYRANSPNRFSQVRNRLQVELRSNVREWGRLFLQLRGDYDPVYDLYTDDFPKTVRDEYRSSLSAENPLKETVREIYLDIPLDTMDIRLGRQQVVWGEAIGLRITDVVNPQDYRNFILDDFVDSRIPMWMARLNYYVDDWTLELLWIPQFEPDREALAGSTWEWTFNRIEPPAGMTVRIFDPEKPDANLENSETGMRLSGLLAGWNLSLSYLNVWDDMPARHVTFNPRTFSLDVSQKYHRLPLWGFTFANAFGSFVPRGEFSYARGKYYSTADPSAVEGLVRKDYLHTMVGTDYSLADFLFTFQVVQKIILDPDEAIYEESVQTSYSVWIQANLLHETLKPELLAIFSPSDEGWMVRPRVAYAATDTITLSAGADLFSGPPRSFFGQFDTNDQVYVKFKTSF